MQPSLLIQLVTGVIAAMVASAIFAHGAAERANRLIGYGLLCAVWWSMCEVVWGLQQEAELAADMVRISGMGWLWLGPLSLDLFSEIEADARSALRRAVPWVYGLFLVIVALYVTTPLGIAEAVRVDGGWSYRFGAGFAWFYAASVLCIAVAIVRWPRLLHGRSRRERQQARMLLIGVLVPLFIASLTDVTLPLLDIHVPRLGSTGLLVVGCTAAWSVRRHGYLLIAPGAFARNIVESLPDGIALLDNEGVIRSANSGLARLFGCPLEAVQGRPFREFVPEVEIAPGSLRKGLLLSLRTRDATAIPVALSHTAIFDRLRRPSGQVVAVHDLREVTTLRQRLLTAGRLTAVGELASGIASEISAPAERARVELLELQRLTLELPALTAEPEDTGATAAIERECAELVAECIEGIERIAGIAHEVGILSGQTRGQIERIQINTVLDSLLGFSSLSGAAHIERFYEELPAIWGDPIQIKQIFFNLLQNAVQATRGQGTVRVSTALRDGKIAVDIEDDGPGIHAALIERIFDPFFTTHAEGEHLGLGLSQSHRLVQLLGGSLRAESQPGRGARFEVLLPIDGGDPDARSALPETRAA